MKPKNARGRAKLSQIQPAERLNVAPSVVSRLEASERAAPQMAKRHLTAVGTELSSQLVQFYEQIWQCIERAFFHPERDILGSAKGALQAMTTLKRA